MSMENAVIGAANSNQKDGTSCEPVRESEHATL